MTATPAKSMAVLINTQSTRCPDDIDGLLAPLRETFDLSVVRAEDPSRFGDHIRDAAASADMIVIGSGDGTLGRSAGSLLAAKLPVGILPMGNANDLARGLGLPLELDAACRALVHSRPVWADVSRVNGHYFFCAATIGIGARISSNMDPVSKRRWKRFSQIPRLVSAIRERRPFTAQLRADELDGVQTFRSVHIAVANGRTHGGGIVVNEDARLDDHRLDVSSVQPQGLARLITLAPALVSGRRASLDSVDHLRATRLELTTSRKLAIATDGDVVTETPARFELLPDAVRFLVPETPEASLAIAREGAPAPSASDIDDRPAG